MSMDDYTSQDERDEEKQQREAARERMIIMDAGLQVLRELRVGGPLQWVMMKAKADAVAAVEDLVRCDPHDAAKIRDLQWAVARYNALNEYAYEIVEEGRAASDDLTDEDVSLMEQAILGDDD